MADDVHSLAAAYALDAVSPEEARAFEEHLPDCETCRGQLHELRQTAALLGAGAAQSPPPELRERVLAQARTTLQTAAAGTGESVGGSVVALEPRAERRRPRAASRWLAGVAAAAVLVAGALGVTAYRADQRADLLQAEAAQVSQVLTAPDAVVQQAPVTGGGTGTLVASPSRGQAVVVTAGLPDAGEGRTYQLWAIDAEGATSIGLLEPDDGRAAELVPWPAGFGTFGMTVEPTGGSEQPTTDPVLLIELPA